ncbi:OPT oligopeptide transporter protein-domain-containing protein [Catenaria anguillulae PL171]|uniref:OPT oligopeptide transporter protein-domain-containing protein n=1 Tax=Catenaria anguillulae PL171 TaxID=765915 RepID=A0A1Y2HLQ2_9FUNG|nr:OPT oligopeptide transporter protein-domain-containing protein [Catenaria anguillulae PL171]
MSTLDVQQRGIRTTARAESTSPTCAPRRSTSVSRRRPSPSPVRRVNSDGLTAVSISSPQRDSISSHIIRPSPTQSSSSLSASSFSTSQQHALPSPSLRNGQPLPFHASNVYQQPQHDNRPPSAQQPSCAPTRPRSQSRQPRPQLSPQLSPSASSSYRPAIQPQLPGLPNLSRSGSATSLTALSVANQLVQRQTFGSQGNLQSNHHFTTPDATAVLPGFAQPPSCPLPATPPQQHAQQIRVQPFHPHAAASPAPSARPLSPIDPYDILADYAYEDDAVEVASAQAAAHAHEERFDLHQLRQPAPWAFKLRTGDTTGLASAVEATAAPSKPMGLKYEEASAPTPFCVDSDFEAVVQQIVPREDYPVTPSLTVRVFFLGNIFNVALAFANTIFSFRTNAFMLTPYVGILLAYPIGKFLENYAPDRTYYTRWFNLSLNPGPFTVKEHVLIGIWATTGASGAYIRHIQHCRARTVLSTQTRSMVMCVVFLVCLNLIGFGFSGLFRRWVIRPPEMVWPSVLPFVSLYSAFHGGLRRDPSDTDSVIDPKHWSKLRLFFIGIFACFAYHMIGPQYMSAGISSIPLLCVAFPKSSTFWRMVVGSQETGVGAFSISLDWSIFGSVSMVTPFWTTLSATIGAVLLQWIATPLATHYNWFSAPAKVLQVVNTLAIFDKTGQSVRESRLVDDNDVTGVHVLWDEYEKLKPFHFSPFFAMAYFASMAQFMSAFVHCIVWYGGDIWRRFRGVNRHKEGLDIHCLLIDQYPEVPHWVYLLLLFLTSAGAVAVFQFTAMAMPWYMTLLAIGFSAVACFPIAVILATTGVQLYLNVVSQFLVGLLMPGYPVVQMAFKSLAVSVGQQCMTLLTDLKLGHYMKIPPRHVFITQISSSVISAAASYAAAYLWLQPQPHRDWITAYNEKHPGVNGPDALAWSSGSNRTFYSASIIWGLIGPRRFFFETEYGAVLILGLAVGAATPIVIKMLDLVCGKRIPWKYVQGPLLFQGVVPGGDTSYVFSQFLVALFFQFFMYRYRTNWWKRYNYILACALDVGVALAAFVSIFLLRGFGFDFPEWLLNPGDNQDLQQQLKLC